jgi:transposase
MRQAVINNAIPQAARDSKMANSSRTWLQIELPPNPFDLNPIENIWRCIKQKIYNGPHPPPKTIYQLRAAVARASMEITEAEVISVIKSMPWCIHECLEREMEITHW